MVTFGSANNGFIQLSRYERQLFSLDAKRVAPCDSIATHGRPVALMKVSYH